MHPVDPPHPVLRISHSSSLPPIKTPRTPPPPPPPLHEKNKNHDPPHIDIAWQQYDRFYLSTLEGRNQDLKGVSPFGTPCWLPLGIRATTARRRRRSKFPNQEIPQEHWELGQQQRGGGGGGDRNSQIKKFLKNIENLGNIIGNIWEQIENMMGTKT